MKLYLNIVLLLIVCTSANSVLAELVNGSDYLNVCSDPSLEKNKLEEKKCIKALTKGSLDTKGIKYCDDYKSKHPEFNHRACYFYISNRIFKDGQLDKCNPDKYVLNEGWDPAKCPAFQGATYIIRVATTEKFDKTKCQEVSDTYALCRDIKYILDPSINDGAKREPKNVDNTEENLHKETAKSM
jgi:hypothetical protein